MKKGTKKGTKATKATAAAKTDERQICPTCGRPIPKHRLTPDQIRAKLEALRLRREKAAEKLNRQSNREKKLEALLAKSTPPETASSGTPGTSA